MSSHSSRFAHVRAREGHAQTRGSKCYYLRPSAIEIRLENLAWGRSLVRSSQRQLRAITALGHLDAWIKPQHEDTAHLVYPAVQGELRPPVPVQGGGVSFAMLGKDAPLVQGGGVSSLQAYA